MKHLSGVPLLGRLLASPTNIRLGWKGLPGTYALAYYKNLYLTAVKSFIALAHGTNIINLFCPYITDFCNKLECLSMASLSSLA